MNSNYCSYVWKLLREEDLNISIVCSDGSLQTNKCFSEFFSGQLSIIKEIISDTCESEIIYLPDFKSEEVNLLLNKFSTFTGKKVSILEDSPATYEIINSPDPSPIEYCDNKASRALAAKALECTTYPNSPAFLSEKTMANCKDKTEIIVSFKPKLHICQICGASFNDSKKLAKHRAGVPKAV